MFVLISLFFFQRLLSFFSPLLFFLSLARHRSFVTGTCKELIPGIRGCKQACLEIYSGLASSGWR